MAGDEGEAVGGNRRARAGRSGIDSKVVMMHVTS